MFICHMGFLPLAQQRVATHESTQLAAYNKEGYSENSIMRDIADNPTHVQRSESINISQT